jgi:hypothetical protein
MQMESYDEHEDGVLEDEVKSELCLATALHEIKLRRFLTLWQDSYESIVFDTKKNTVGVCIDLC